MASEPILTPEDLQHLAQNGFVVVESFLSSNLYDNLRRDLKQLRSLKQFQIAKIGHDGMVQDENTPFKDIRYSETCFIGRLADEKLPPSSETKARHELYDVLDQLKNQLETDDLIQQGRLTKSIPTLDKDTEELMYAYYPQGGYYRRHRDAEPGSVSNWRKYSLLLYLNDKDWKEQDGGQLRIHRDSGGDELPPGELPNFIDVQPKAGTLVLFRSDQCPHEVIDTHRERMVVVGWFLSQEPSGPETTDALGIQKDNATAMIDAKTLTSLRALRDANPRLKNKLEPPPPPANPPSALSIWGDDYVIPGAVANPTRAPVQEETFPDTDHRYWRKIATFDTKGHVNTLSLSAIRMNDVAGFVSDLLDNAVTLDLANTHLPVEQLASIINMVNEKAQKLKQLRLGGNCLKCDDLSHILTGSSTFLSHLASLDLRYNDIGPTGAECLATALLEQSDSCCRTLYLEGTKLGDMGAKALAKVSFLDELYLGSNDIGPEGASHLAATAVSSWKKLYLEGNRIEDAGAEAFIEQLKVVKEKNQKRLQRLFVDNNGISKGINLKLGNAVGSATLIGESGIFQ